MGSYDLTCFVTKQNIGCGDKVCFIPLKKAKYNEFADGNFAMMNVTGLYHPATLPIVGVYDDYGRIEVEKDAHTDFLEAFYGKSIEEITDIEGGLFDSGCYVHHAAYRGLMEHLNSWDGKPEKENYFEKDFKKWSADTKRNVEHHEKMLRLCAKDDQDDEYTQKMIADSTTALETFDFGLEMGNVFGFCSTRDFGHFQMYKKSIYMGDLNVDWFIDFFNFMKNLYAIATPLAPVLGGEQHGNVYMAKRLADVTNTILDKQYKTELKNLEDY